MLRQLKKHHAYLHKAPVGDCIDGPAKIESEPAGVVHSVRGSRAIKATGGRGWISVPKVLPICSPKLRIERNLCYNVLIVLMKYVERLSRPIPDAEREQADCPRRHLRATRAASLLRILDVVEHELLISGLTSRRGARAR